MASPNLWIPTSPMAGKACPAPSCSLHPLASELARPVIHTPASREVAIAWRRPSSVPVAVLRLGPH